MPTHINIYSIFFKQAKELELNEIESLLQGKMRTDQLKRYQENFLLSDSMRSLPTQSDSDE